jgi:hypothetical protein
MHAMTIAARRKWIGRLLLSVIFLAGDCDASAPCAATIGDLRALLIDEAFPLKWYETTMDDDKPLVLSILETKGALFLTFVKTGEGLWAESAGILCLNGEDLETRFSEDQVRLGPAAHWATRMALANGGQFTLRRLGAERLHIATVGWSGMFSSREKRR